MPTKKKKIVTEEDDTFELHDVTNLPKVQKPVALTREKVIPRLRRRGQFQKFRNVREYLSRCCPIP